MQAGCIGLIQAEATFDPEKAAWGTWAGYYIRREMQEALELWESHIRAHKQSISLDEPLADTEGITLADALEDPSANTEEQADVSELQSVVRQRVSALPAGREIVELCDLKGATMAEAVHRTGMPVGYARRRKYKA